MIEKIDSNLRHGVNNKTTLEVSEEISNDS